MPPVWRGARRSLHRRRKKRRKRERRVCRHLRQCPERPPDIGIFSAAEPLEPSPESHPARLIVNKEVHHHLGDLRAPRRTKHAVFRGPRRDQH
ncbi:hypothetical protein DPEC_G00378590, partial [Dallia pectoralis]